MMTLLLLRVVRPLAIPLWVKGFLEFNTNLFTAWNSTATWGSWGSWSECSQSAHGAVLAVLTGCIEGSKRRERQCLYDDGVVAASSQCDRCETGDISCSDGSIEYERCNEGACSGSTGVPVLPVTLPVPQGFPNSNIYCLPHPIRLGVFFCHLVKSVSLFGRVEKQ